MDEHVLAAIVANDEAEAFLRVEEFDDALAFADDLGGHAATSSAAAAATEATAASAAAAEATATAAAGSIAEATATAAAEAAAITEPTAACAAAGSEAAAFRRSTTFAAEILFEETVALIAAAPAAVAFAPFIETHARPNFRMPTNS
jgi:hypothetical protein